MNIQSPWDTGQRVSKMAIHTSGCLLVPMMNSIDCIDLLE